MVLQKYQISPQYFTKNQITVTILDVLNPNHYVVKETPSLDGSSEAKNFMEAEKAMQKYYESVEPCFFQLPLKDAIIVALIKDKFYRAKVIRILTMSAGHLFKVYLVDYGVEDSVSRECIYEIENDFLLHPFQAVHLKLIGIEPISLVMDSVNLSMSYGPVTKWDPSSEVFVHELQRGMCNAYIEVQAVDTEYIYGKLFISYENNVTKCINDELVSNSFARFNEDYCKNVQKIDVCENINSKIEDNEIVESLKFQELNPKQISSRSEHENFGSVFRTTLVNPSDGMVVAESFVTDCSTVDAEKDLQPEEHVEESKPPTSSPISDISEEQSIAQKKFMKLQQLRRRQLRSPICANNKADCTSQKSSPIIDVTVNEKTVSPSNICAVKIKQPSTELSPRNFEKSIIDNFKGTISNESSVSSIVSSNKSSDCNNFKSNNLLDEKPSASNDVIQEETKQEDMTEAQLIAQKRFQRLQQMRRKKLQSPACSPVADSTMNKSSSAKNVYKANSPILSPESSQKRVDCNISPGKSLSTTIKNEVNLTNPCIESPEKKDVSVSSDRLSISVTESETNLSNLSIDSSQERYDSSTSPDKSHLSSDYLKSSQSSPSNSVSVSSEGSSKQENTSEIILENVKTLQRLQNRVRKKKVKQPISVPDEPLDLKKIHVTFNDKCTIDYSRKSKQIFNNADQLPSSSSLPRLSSPVEKK